MQPFKVAVRAYLAIVTFALVACTGSDTSSADATSSASPGAGRVPVVAPATSASFAPGAAIDKNSISYAKGNEKASYGVAGDAEFAAIGLPVYATMRNPDATYVRHSDAKEDAETVYGRTSDPFETVDAWYAQHLGNAFKVTRLNAAGTQVTTFTKNVPGDYESVLLRGGKNVKASMTDVTLLVKKAR